MPLSEEQRAELERRELEEQKLKEAIAEKTPSWQLFCDLEGEEQYLEEKFWSKYAEELCE